VRPLTQSEERVALSDIHDVQLDDFSEPSATEVPYDELPPFPAPLSTPPVKRKSDPSPKATVTEPEEIDDSDDEIEDEADDSGASETPEQELARLREEMQKAQERIKAVEDYEKRVAQQQRQAQDEQVQRYWNTAHQQAERWFAAQKERIYREAEDAIAPAAYIRQQVAVLDQQRAQWFSEFIANREAAIQQEAIRVAYPSWVAEVADYYELSDEEYEELFDYHQDEVIREAEKMKRRRTQAAERAKAEQQKRRKEKREALRESMPSGTGESGRGLVGDPNTPKDSDEYYHSIPWERR